MNGEWLFDFLREMNRSNNPGGTSHHRSSNRELDYIFSSYPITDVQLAIPEIRNLSDHDPVAVSIQVPTARVTASIPDKRVARQLFNTVL